MCFWVVDGIKAVHLMECSTHLIHFTRGNVLYWEWDWFYLYLSFDQNLRHCKPNAAEKRSIHPAPLWVVTVPDDCAGWCRMVQDGAWWFRMVQNGAGGAYCALGGSSLKSEQSYGHPLVFISELLKIEGYLCSVLTFNLDLNIDTIESEFSSTSTLHCVQNHHSVV